MSLRRRVFQGAMSLAAGQALGQGLSFVRNVIVARLLSPEDFGVAATFAITVSLFEMLSDLAVDKLIIQAKDGDDPRLQATAQAFQSLRGLICGLLTAALAWPIALLFGTPEALWAYMLLGLVPLLRGLAHLDVGRLQREMRFGPAVITQVGSQLAAVFAAWPLARWLGDWSAMLWIVLIQSAVLALLSHVVARRPYAWAWDAVQLRRLLAFGWPLLINGVLMFGVFQGDRVIIGGLFSKPDLALFSVVFSTAFVVPTLLASMSLSLMLPLFAGVQDSPDRLRARYALAAQAFAVVAGVFAVMFVALGPWLIGLLFGPAYGNAPVLVGWVALMQAARLLRMPPTVAAMACGDTRNSMIANIARISAVPVVLAAALAGAPLATLAAIGFFGELAGLAAAVIRLSRRQALSASTTLWPVTIVATVAALVCYPSMTSHLPLSVASGLAAVGAFAITVVSLSFAALRSESIRWTAALFHRPLAGTERAQ